MRRTVAAAVALALVLAGLVVGVAGAGQTTVRVGNLVVSASPDISPRELSKTVPSPVALLAAGGVATTDGSHPPAPQTVMIEEDRHVTVSTRGYPTCRAAQLQSADTDAALAECRPALVGEGTVQFEIGFEGTKPIRNRSRLLIFNGGESHGVTTLLIHAFVTVPVRAAVVVPLQIRRVSRGRFGLLMQAQVPKIAGGAGSVTEFRLRLARQLGPGRKQPGVFAATCTDGRLQTKVTTRFASGQTVRAELISGCTPKP
jgi:hypothetical protein